MQLVLAGHNHHYERLIEDNITYIIQGTGGGSPDTVSTQVYPGSQKVVWGEGFGGYSAGGMFGKYMIANDMPSCIPRSPFLLPKTIWQHQVDKGHTGLVFAPRAKLALRKKYDRYIRKRITPPLPTIKKIDLVATTNFRVLTQLGVFKPSNEPGRWTQGAENAGPPKRLILAGNPIEVWLQQTFDKVKFCDATVFQHNRNTQELIYP